MNGSDRPEGRPQGVGTPSKVTKPRRPHGTYLRLHGDAETVAAELIERVGPAAALALAAVVVASIGGTR